MCGCSFETLPCLYCFKVKIETAMRLKAKSLSQEKKYFPPITQFGLWNICPFPESKKWVLTWARLKKVMELMANGIGYGENKKYIICLKSTKSKPIWIWKLRYNPRLCPQESETSVKGSIFLVPTLGFYLTLILFLFQLLHWWPGGQSDGLPENSSLRHTLWPD